MCCVFCMTVWESPKYETKTSFAKKLILKIVNNHQNLHMNNFPPNFNLSKSVVDSIFNGVSQAIAPKVGKKKKRKLEVMMRDQFTNRSFEQASTSSSQPNRKPEVVPKVKIPAKLRLKSGAEINLNDHCPGIFQTANINQFNEKLLNANNFWNLIIVHHFGRVSKQQTLYCLNEVAKENLFAAYCYTEGTNFDFFLVYNQDNFLFELIKKKLRVKIELEEIPLELRIKVGVVMPPHPKFGVRSLIVIKNQIQNAARYGGEDVFDLSSFSSLMAEHDIEVTLKNKPAMLSVFNQINGIEILKDKFHIFKFARNGISSVEAMGRLYGFALAQPWRILDLSENNLDSVHVLKDLKHINIKELILSGNEVTKLSSYRERIRNILPNVESVDPKNDFVDESFAQDLIIPPAPTLGQIKLQAEPPNPARPQKAKFAAGIGNDAITQIDDGVLIRRDNTKRGQDPQWIHLRDSFQSYRNDNMWTQVVVHHGAHFQPQEIIDEIVANVLVTNPFFPCFYKHLLEHDEFFLFKNFDALNSLMKSDLEHMMPNNKKITFTLRLNAAPYVEGQTNWFHKIHYVIKKRLKIGKMLDLDDFSNDPDFSNMMVPTNSKYTLGFILDSAKRQSSAISNISARNNGITSFEFLQSLAHYPQLTTLDLRNNKISTLEGTYSKTLTVTELFLDGNPICERLGNTQGYVSGVKKHFASLEMLDGCKIDKTVDLVPLQNYFVKRDAYIFAGEFVKTFIPLYDSFERHRLLEMYTDGSIFTLSFHYPYTRDFGQDDVYSKIQKYLRYARNLGLLSDISKSVDNVVYGKKNIAKVFAEMSKTSHNTASLCVEVLSYEPTRFIILKLSGVFEEQGQSLNESSLNMGYARTFVIAPAENNQFVITNDQLFVHKSPAVIKVPRSEEKVLMRENCFDILPTENEEKKLKLVLFEELTELKREVCTRHLEESFWDIKIALATFNTLMDSGDIKDCDFNFK